MRPALLLLLALLLAPATGNSQTVCSVVENAETEVQYRSATDVQCRKRRSVTVLHPKGLGAAHFLESYQLGRSELKKFSGTVTDADGKVLHRIKKRDLEISEYSTEMASDVYRHYYQYTPLRYPFTVTYEWEEQYTDGIIMLPTFAPQEEYHQSVKHASYTLQRPADLPCRHLALHLDVPTEWKTTGDGKQVMHIEVTDLPPLIPEHYGLPATDLLPCVLFVPTHFSFGKTKGNMESWQSYGLWEYSLLEGRDQLPEGLLAKLKELTAPCRSDRERVEAIYNYLGENTRYVSIQLGIGGFQPVPAADVYRTGYGDCKALSNYMRAMLSAVGIPSLYTEISTENERYLPHFASANQGNHIILQVPLPQDTLWLECTNPSIPLGYVHSNIAGHDALLLTPQGGQLHTLPAYADSLHSRVNHATVTLTAEGGADITVRQHAALARYEEQLALSSQPQQRQQELLRSSLNLLQADVRNIHIEEQASALPVIHIAYDISTRQYGTRTGKRFFLPLNIFRNPFVPTESGRRTQDVVVSEGYSDTDSIEIILPPQFAVESLPRPFSQEHPFGSFHASLSADNGKLKLVQRLVMKRGRYAKEEYAALVEFRKRVAEQYAAKVIVRKEEPASTKNQE